MSLIGQQVGHIRIIGHLARGGMGDVYYGFDDTLHRQVAVKSLHDSGRLSELSKSRFLREARILSQLDHPGICRIYDLIEQDGIDFLILEYIEGKTLRQLMNEKALGYRDRLRVAVEILRALATAHREGIVHRDLKPDNIMLTSDDQVKILDFGISRSVERQVTVIRSSHGGDEDSRTRASQKRVDDDGGDFEGFTGGDDTTPRTAGMDGNGMTLCTADGSVVGTVRYMSPEQAAGDAVAEPSDMYSLGIMLHELFSDDPPYGDARGTDLLLKVYRAEARPISGVDADLEHLIQDLKRVDPQTRPGAEEAERRLTWILDTPLRARAKRIRWAVVAGFVALVLAGAGLIWREQRQAERRAEVIQVMTQEAETIDWLMRAEHLSPPHDIRSAEERVRAMMERVRHRMDTLGGIGDGPGSYALGRGEMVLGEYRNARDNLERAWAAGFQGPKTAYALALTLSELYRSHRNSLQSISDPKLREAEEQRLRRELRDPALEMLSEEGLESVAPPDFIAAMIALNDGQYGEALERSSMAAGEQPWFYEAAVLAGDALYGMAAERFGEGDARAQIESLGEALTWYQRASAVARSDPAVAARLAETRQQVLWSKAYNLRQKLDGDEIRGVIAETKAIEELDPEYPLVFATRSRLHQLECGMASRDGEDPKALCEAAFEEATEAIKLDPENASYYQTRGFASQILARHYSWRGQPSESFFEQAIADFEYAHELAPEDLAGVKNLAETHMFFASAIMDQGKNPLQQLDAGLSVLRPVLTRDHVPSTVYFTAGGCYFYRARWLAGQGEDPIPDFDASAKSYRRASQSATRPAEFSNLALVLFEKGDYLLQTGRDPTRSLREAIEASRKGLELSKDFGLGYFNQGLANFGLARWAILTGDDPKPYLERVLDLYDQGLKVAPENTYAYPEIGLFRVAESRYLLEHDQSPMESIQAGERAIQQGLDVYPGFGPSYRILAELALVRARWFARSTVEDAEPIFTMAKSLIKQAKERVEGDAHNDRTLAEICEYQARSILAQRGDPSAVISEGLTAAENAVAINSQLAEAFLAKAELLRLRAKQRAQSRAGEEARRAARIAFKKACEINPLVKGHHQDLDRWLDEDPE